jgi:mono/diheme cytochrome c family protein
MWCQRCAALLLTLTASIGMAAPPDFDFQALQGLIARERIGSIEALLAALPTDLRANYVLVFSSRSLQQGTLRDPRAILYGSDAHLMLSFNGDAAERGYGAIETAEFDPGLGVFRFRELRFVSSPEGPVAQFSEANSERCQRCHGAPARPLWDSSPLWPGAYGERYRTNPGSAERAGIAQFLRRQSEHPRYRALLEASRYAERDTFAPNAGVQYSGEQREPPNAQFAGRLARMNLQAIARELRERPGFDSLGYALLGAAEASCGSTLEFLPVNLRAAVGAALGHFEAAAATERARAQQSKRLRALPGTATLRMPGAGAPGFESVDTVRFLAETGLGMGTRQWSLELEKGPLAPSGQRDADGTLADALRVAVARLDPHVAALASSREYSSDDRYCAYLRERSRSALASIPGGYLLRLETRGPNPESSAPALESILRHCATCHGDGTAPPLPFSDPELLAPLLRQPGHTHGQLLDELLFRISPQAGPARMPPDELLAPGERDALDVYLKGLAPPH